MMTMEDLEKKMLVKLIMDLKPICNYCGTYLKDNFTCPSCKVDNSIDYKEYIKVIEDSKKEIKSNKVIDDLKLEFSIKEDIDKFNKNEEKKREMNQVLKDERTFVEKFAVEKITSNAIEKIHPTRKEKYLLKKVFFLSLSWILFITIGYNYTNTSYLCSPYSNCVSYAYPYDYVMLFGIFVILIVVTVHFIYEINIYITRKRINGDD